MKSCSICKIKKSLADFPKHKQYTTGYYSACKNCTNIKNRAYYNKVKDNRKQQFKEYYLKNKTHLIKKNSRRSTVRRQTDITARISANLRRRLNHLIRGTNKSGSAIKDLGCTLPEFKVYLELRFQFGMNWDNYGKWHIDHIKPLSKFNLLEREDLKKACHYTNLQPLWASDNISKNNKY